MNDKHWAQCIGLDSVAPMVVSVRRLPGNLRDLVDLARRKSRPGQLPLLILRVAGRPDALVVTSGADFETFLRYGRQQHAPIDNAQDRMGSRVAGSKPEPAEDTLDIQGWAALAATLEMEVSTMEPRAQTATEPNWFPDLGSLADAAGVTFAVAEAAESARLIQRQQFGYRGKLLPWLKKLARLTEAGYTWPEIRAWVQRRGTQGHEDESRWPCGFEP